MKLKNITLKFTLCFFIILSLSAAFSAYWYIKVSGNVGFTSIVFTLFSGLTGAEEGLFFNYALHALIPEVILSLFFCVIAVFPNKIKYIFEKITHKSIHIKKVKTFISVITVSVCVISVSYAAIVSGMPEWIIDMFSNSDLYKTEYVDPENTNIEFPEEKRNLIYIYLESMTTTFFSKEHGGQFDEDIIPNLYNMAKDNINFSQSNDVGGWGIVSNTTWTMASLVSQTAGVPFLLPVENNIYCGDNTVLPGLFTLNDILHENGYYQVMMVGSDGSYAGRDKYFLQHGTDEFLDNSDAEKAGIIEKDYSAWWGMEDLYLYNFAKEKLNEISKKGTPFSFTMLTVDTHHIGGYRCALCGDEYDEDYLNVFKCADKQIYEFLIWLKEQDFYNNTTIVICGDHKSMDNEFMERNTEEDFEHRIYNCFINSVAQSDNTKKREISPFDMFPTTLASMGCKIEGDRLGLGTNLFSEKQTLTEKYGYNEYNELLENYSVYYLTNFIKCKKQN